MTTQAVRARVAEEGPDIGSTFSARLSVTVRAVCGPRMALRGVLSLLVFIACASIHACAGIRSGAGSSTSELAAGADFAAFPGESPALFVSMFEPAQYRQNSGAFAVCELAALAAIEAEQEGELDAHILGIFATRVVAALPCSRQTLRAAPVAYPARFLISWALPRGPPYTSC